ncbi:hypothetical protein GQF01_12120 [Paenibacillus sp. 5J-6]|uniref:Uncharacterized protein n=1 Tax=Paenibacillus silvestris TaxID=2606219 RepID=A0A6L8V0S8_9BACL|nr:hypothetical protein [Paenibacillus silvestris]MZQ82850.1 hypothetical protein [Paenibacillus silvestris]
MDKVSETCPLFLLTTEEKVRERVTFIGHVGTLEAVNVNSVYSRKGSVTALSRNFNGSWFDWSVCRNN